MPFKHAILHHTLIPRLHSLGSLHRQRLNYQHWTARLCEYDTHLIRIKFDYNLSKLHPPLGVQRR